MIFLSHTHKDKALVEPFALALSREFGQANVFYDSWSIQPGEGIIDKMNEGLGKTAVMFYFVSANSLHSKMVDLEWQNALMASSKGQIRLIPIRTDGADVPPILRQTVYLDLYNNSLKSMIEMAVKIARGENVFSPQHEDFINIRAHIRRAGNRIHFRVEALRLREPHCDFMCCIENDPASFSLGMPGMVEYHRVKGFTLFDGSIVNAVGMKKAGEVISPGMPIDMVLFSRNDEMPRFIMLLHREGDQYLEVPIASDVSETN